MTSFSYQAWIRATVVFGDVQVTLVENSGHNIHWLFGHIEGLRTWLERRRQPSVMAVPSTEPVVLELPAIGVRRLEVRDALPLLAPSDWSQLSLSQGTKGPRLFGWACVPVWHQGRDDGWHSLLIRRPREADFDPTFSLVLAPPTTCLQTTVTALGERWRVEEDVENSKDLGLDHSHAMRNEASSK